MKSDIHPDYAPIVFRDLASRRDLPDPFDRDQRQDHRAGRQDLPGHRRRDLVGVAPVLHGQAAHPRLAPAASRSSTRATRASASSTAHCIVAKGDRLRPVALRVSRGTGRLQNSVAPARRDAHSGSSSSRVGEPARPGCRRAGRSSSSSSISPWGSISAAVSRANTAAETSVLPRRPPRPGRHRGIRPTISSSSRPSSSCSSRVSASSADSPGSSLPPACMNDVAAGLAHEQAATVVVCHDRGRDPQHGCRGGRFSGSGSWLRRRLPAPTPIPAPTAIPAPTPSTTRPLDEAVDSPARPPLLDLDRVDLDAHHVDRDQGHPAGFDDPGRIRLVDGRHRRTARRPAR